MTTPEQAARIREAICNAYGPHDLAGYQDESRCRAIADAALADAGLLAHQAPAAEDEAAEVTFTAEEVVQIANETSDSFGNLYYLDFIVRIRHEASRERHRA